jgi:hypothetical protein
MKRLRFVWKWLKWFTAGPGFSYSQHLDDNTRKILWRRWFEREPRL